MAKYQVLRGFKGIEEERTFKTGEVAEFTEKRAAAINRALPGALLSKEANAKLMAKKSAAKATPEAEPELETEG